MSPEIDPSLPYQALSDQALSHQALTYQTLPYKTLSYQTLIEQLKQYPTRSVLYLSQFYQEHHQQLNSIIDTIQTYQPSSNNTSSTNASPIKFLRAVQWNIERGKHLAEMIKVLRTHPQLAQADIITLNEVDVGMIRTDNKNIANELAQHLGMYAAFIPEYLELTKGIREELQLSGENHAALHGNAILSRYALQRVKAVRLPCCFDTFEFAEKRYGERVALLAEIAPTIIDSNGVIQTKPLIIASTHLEVRKTLHCRARQFRVLLEAIDDFNVGRNLPVLIGGDLNTGTFERGNLFYTLQAGIRLLKGEPAEIAQQLRHPEQVEPLFKLAQQLGYQMRDFNDDQPTCSTPLNHLDEASRLPKPLQRWVDQRMARYQQLDFRLDFFFAKGLHPLQDNELTENSRISQHAQTIAHLINDNGKPLSDHDAIVCDFIMGKR